MKNLKKLGSKLALVPAASLVMVTQAYAEVPQTVKTAIEGAKTDGLDAGWLVIGVLAALFVLTIVRRVLR